MKRLPLLISAFMVLTACEKTPPPEEPDIPDNPTTEENTGYPKGITVTAFAEDLEGGAVCSGYIAEIDFNANPNLGFGVSYTVPKKTPSDIYKSYKKGKAEIIINGGYFAGSTSVSQATIAGFSWSLNAPSINWPGDSNYERTVYPVRSALGRMDDGRFETHWVYCTDKSGKTVYSYPSALGNNEKTKTFMDEPPTPDTPGAVLWNPVEAIGGGPRIVEGGKDVATENYWKEVFHSGGTAGETRQPRTAIGLTKDNKLIMIVCDGRKMNGSAGFTLSELARKFISLGVVDAINLDGGGSSCMVGKDGEVLNRPSDSGLTGNIVERKVVTAVVIYTTKD